jgi:hypothetical protein
MSKPAVCKGCGQILPPKVVLPKMRQRIYDYVAAHPNGIAVGEIADHIYSDDRNGGPGNADVTIRTQIWHINHKCLRPIGLEIRGKSGPQGLYRLQVYTP